MFVQPASSMDDEELFYVTLRIVQLNGYMQCRGRISEAQLDREKELRDELYRRFVLDK